MFHRWNLKGLDPNDAAFVQAGIENQRTRSGRRLRSEALRTAFGAIAVVALLAGLGWIASEWDASDGKTGLLLFAAGSVIFAASLAIVAVQSSRSKQAGVRLTPEQHREVEELRLGQPTALDVLLEFLGFVPKVSDVIGTAQKIVSVAKLAVHCTVKICTSAASYYRSLRAKR